MIEELLYKGSENAFPTGALMNITGLNRRALYAQIEKERRNGSIILSDRKGGYYLPDLSTEEGREEVRKFEKSMRNMAISLFAASKSAREALKESGE